MTEYSYPIENEPMPGSNWSSVTKGIGNGILDEGGFPYNLINLNNATNKATVTAANLGDGVLRSHAILDGFYHRIDANVVIDLPAVTKATTYYVALQFVPTRATEGKLPVQLGVFTSLDRTQGKDYLVLWTIVRQANQLLTDAAVTMGRQRVAGTVVVASEANLPPANSVLWGTVGVIHNGRDSDRAKIVMAITDSSETTGWKWKTLSDRGEVDDETFTWDLKNNTETYNSPVADGFKRAIGRRQKRRKLRGRVGLISGNDFVKDGEYRVFSTGVGSGDTPERVQAFTTTVGGVSGGIGFARIEVRPDGDVIAWPSKNTAWISLDGIEWEVP
ncbi:hypothetical protein Bra3105_06820 [Brachybacterium halotolerans subsp. kimchii]|uniref:hypothetical protein n=1 Tax=Brachybacterium halotolerans TaxID=2795215 RepID=UPI001E54BF6F|nr:hypothetical protein [Brachybacterium halotolerans]UEJ84019.1 hypothetical protein Bra3105_06820 [Brachybacterium halotolerans subsp. kimchii]